MIIISLIPDHPIDDLLTGSEKNIVVYRPVVSEQHSWPRILATFRYLMEEVRKSPQFNILDQVVVICRPSMVSTAFVIGIKAAFNDVKVWLQQDKFGKPFYLDLQQIEAEGIAFKMSSLEKEAPPEIDVELMYNSTIEKTNLKKESR